MGFDIRGYVLESVRLGQANNAFTQSPDTVVTDLNILSFYPPDESKSRADYIVLVQKGGLLEEAQLGFSRNDNTVSRFDYSAKAGRFFLLKGAPVETVGTLNLTSNDPDSRLKVRAPTEISADAPFRVSIDEVNTFTPILVNTDSEFSNPVPSGSVTISLESGLLNWNTGDLTSFEGGTVQFQRQQFYTDKESNGALGKPSTFLRLNPIPGTGQFPVIRFGRGLPLTVVEVPDESSFTSGVAGTVEWALDTGKLNFHHDDILEYATREVIYDGVLLGSNLGLNSEAIGSVSSPTPITSVTVDSHEELVFKLPSGYRFPTVSYVASLTSPGKSGEVQVDFNGNVKFSNADQNKYGPTPVTVYFGNLFLERGIAISLYRTPVNLDGTAGVNDLTQIYEVEGALWADPIIASPQIFTPSVPIDDPAYLAEFKVLQNQGSFTSDNFPRLDALAPMAGLGYYIAGEQFYFAQRKVDQISTANTTTSTFNLPDALLLDGSVSLSLETPAGSDNYVPLVIGSDAVLDLTSGAVSKITNTGVSVVGSASITGNVLSDPEATFSGNVNMGDVVEVLNTASKGVYYVTAVSNTTLTLDYSTPVPASFVSYRVWPSDEILADRYFTPFVALDPHTSVEKINGSTTVVLDPSEYVIQPELGFVKLSTRLLKGERVRISYKSKDGNLYQEDATFQIGKELCTFTGPTSTIPFNPENNLVASFPAPKVFRGGRPQKTGTQVTVDTDNSLITFLADSQVTDALPHGSIVGDTERVYIDYSILTALGGENSFSVLHPEMEVITVSITELDTDGNSNNKFEVPGDQTNLFQPNTLFRLNSNQYYLVGSSTFSSGVTTITLAPNTYFADDFTNPVIEVASGPTSLLQYFAPVASFNQTPRGSTVIEIPGSVVSFFTRGKVLVLGNQLLGVLSAVEKNGVTKVSVSAPTLREYIPGTDNLKISVRQIFDSSTISTVLSRTPEPTLPIVVFSKITGQPGVVLTKTVDYALNDAGAFILNVPLEANQEVSALYNGLETVEAGTKLKATYTCQISPNADNGLLGQTLAVNYFTESPDTFYFRVESLTNFRGEYQTELETSGSSTSGPRTSNMSTPKLYEQGKAGLYFDERHLANQDIVARSTLLFYTEAARSLELLRQATNGLVVGNNDGTFLFDGNTGEICPPATIENQIDDTIKISDAPYQITYSPFAVTSIGTFRKYYLPGDKSRFFPTSRDFFGYVIPGTHTAGQEVLDTKNSKLLSVSNVHTRLAWAVILKPSSATGSTLEVDFTGLESGFSADAEKYARPPFQNNMKCWIVDRDGNLTQSTSVQITGLAANKITVSGLTDVVPEGSTIYRSLQDDSTQTGVDALFSYNLGSDYGYNSDSGQITYVPATTPAGDNHPLVSGQPISGKVSFTNTLTEPYRFPALFGGMEDDDGDLSFPVQTPDTNSLQSCLLIEQEYETSGGDLHSVTSPTFGGVGSLDVTKKIISGAFSTTGIQIYDLLRITSGTNGSTAYHRITGVAPNSLTVLEAFVTQDTLFTFEVTKSLVATASTCTVSGTTLTNLAANFTTQVKPGWTIIATGGSNAGLRRQVESITDNQHLVLETAFPSNGTFTYRISNALATYGTFSSTISDQRDYIANVTQREHDTLFNQIDYAQGFLNTVFSDLVTGTASVSGSVLTDASATFGSAGVAIGDFIYIELPEGNHGVYEIQSVDSNTHITITGSFPISGVTTYRAVGSFGAEFETLKNIESLVNYATQELAALSPFLSTLDSIPVLSDSQAFATGVTTNGLLARNTHVATLLGGIQDNIDLIEDPMYRTDQLYEKRWVWVDARINLENGLLIRQTQATTNRLKTAEQNRKQLIKLLAVKKPM